MDAARSLLAGGDGIALGESRTGPVDERRRAFDPIGLLYYSFCVQFVWDERKAAANVRKHGVSFDEAATAFDDPLAAYYPDSLHEDRFILIGSSGRHRLLYVVHAEVAVAAIRIISARKATKDEKAHYEND